MSDYPTVRPSEFAGRNANTLQGETIRRIELYVRRWMRWLVSGVTVSDTFKRPVLDPELYAFASSSLPLKTLIRLARG